MITVARNKNRGYTRCSGCSKNVEYDDLAEVVIGPDTLGNVKITLCGACRLDVGETLAPRRKRGRPSKLAEVS